MEVPDEPHLPPRPPAQHPPVVRPERRCGDVVVSQRLPGRLRRRHPRLHREVDPLDALGIHEPRRVADDEAAVRREARQGVRAALRDGLGAVGDALAPLEEPREERVRLEALHRLVRVEQRVAVVERNDEPEGDVRVPHMVDEPAAERLQPEGEPDCVAHVAGPGALGPHPPYLLHPQRVALRVFPLEEPLLGGKRLRQRAARPLGEHREAGAYLRARLELFLLRAGLVAPAVLAPHPRDALPVPEELVRGEMVEQVRAERLRLLSHPAREAREGDDRVPLVGERGRGDRRRDAPTPEQPAHLVRDHLRLDRGALQAPARHQGVHRARIEHGAGEVVGAEARGLLDHGDEQIALLPRPGLRVVLTLELQQPDGARERRGAGADEQDIDLEDFPLLRHNVPRGVLRCGDPV